MNSSALSKLVRSLAREMTNIHGQILNYEEWGSEREVQEMRASWEVLEQEVLRLIPLSDPDILAGHADKILCSGSRRIIEGYEAAGITPDHVWIPPFAQDGF